MTLRAKVLHFKCKLFVGNKNHFNNLSEIESKIRVNGFCKCTVGVTLLFIILHTVLLSSIQPERFKTRAAHFPM